MIFLLFSVMPLTIFFGCSPTQHPREQKLKSWLQNDTELKVLSTTAMIEDIVRQVGGEKIKSMTLITGQLDPHTYQLVKGDDEKIAAADIIFFNGLGLEHGPSLQRFLGESQKAIGLGDIIKSTHPDLILSQDGQLDPHIWMDISIWKLTVEIIASELAKQNPQGAQYFQANSLRIMKQMEEENNEIFQLLQLLPPEKRYLVTSHDAFNYFTKAYLSTPQERIEGSWRNRVAAPEGLAPEGQLSAKDIQDIIEYLVKYHVAVIFPESNVSKDALKKIVDAGNKAGIDVKMAQTVLYADAMGPQGSDGDTYLKMIKHNASTIESYLK